MRWDVILEAPRVIHEIINFLHHIMFLVGEGKSLDNLGLLTIKNQKS